MIFMRYFVYIIENQHGARYIGQTGNVDLRLKAHNGNISFYTRNKGPWRTIYTEEFGTRGEAMKREKQIKSYRGGEALKKLLINKG